MISHRLGESICQRQSDKGLLLKIYEELLKHVYYHMLNRWPVQVWCMKQGTRSWCSGTTQRDGVEKEVGGGFRMGGTHVHPWLIHADVWQKPQYFKAVILQLINLKKELLKTNIKKTKSLILKWAKNYNKRVTKLKLKQWNTTKHLVEWPKSRRPMPPKSGEQQTRPCIASVLC